jgi:phosphatidylserine/phosphatidylglycerophosphate/cardiolipin synthase-like enzyme
VNVALRAVHDALSGQGEPAVLWSSLMAALCRQAGTDGVAGTSTLRPVLRSVGCEGTASEWLTNLRLLKVVDDDGQIDRERASLVGAALELVADSFAPLGPQSTWAPVATLPPELRVQLHPPPIRHTAGVLLDLVDRATREIHLTAPFADQHAVEFLTQPLIAAGRRGVEISIVTSSGHANLFADAARQWNADPEIRSALRLSEVQTHLSPLGSHAKVLVVDSERGYVGSANLTSAGLGRQVEIGVELAGPQVADLARVLIALDRIGTPVLTAGGHR